MPDMLYNRSLADSWPELEAKIIQAVEERGARLVQILSVKHAFGSWYEWIAEVYPTQCASFSGCSCGQTEKARKRSSVR